jgi:hypothetical protein
LSLNLKRSHIDRPEAHEAGLFFGWRGQNIPFFVVQLDRRPPQGNDHGAVHLGWARIARAAGARGGFFAFLNDLRTVTNKIPLTAAREPDTIVVRFQNDRVTVKADDEPPALIDLRDIRNLEFDPLLRTQLNPQGMLGVWVRRGLGCFPRGTITYLDPPRPD